jgi:hypothetical protein
MACMDAEEKIPGPCVYFCRPIYADRWMFGGAALFCLSLLCEAGEVRSSPRVTCGSGRTVVSEAVSGGCRHGQGRRSPMLRA